jgi:hypothetical protein
LWGRIPYYPIKKLDEWVMARLSPRRSTSDRGTIKPLRAPEYAQEARHG